MIRWMEAKAFSKCKIRNANENAILVAASKFQAHPKLS